MITIGIICEYNPFHNGHLYHLNKIKEMFPDSLIVLVLNGYFLERGEISIINKKDKAKIALENGIDLVVELPFIFGTQSADIFANTSITILEKLKCDYIVFGSESNDIDSLNKICDYTIKNKVNYDKKTKEFLDQGFNYPTALAKAINIDFNYLPNDLLGLSYIKSIKSNHYNIKPLTIKRTNSYLDTSSNDDIISANNIREKLKNKEKINKYIPKNVIKYINNISLNDLFPYIKYKILTSEDLSIYLDVDEGIENRLLKVVNKCNNIEELINAIKTKRYTYNKIRRMLIHILIGLTKKDNMNCNLSYIKVIGFNRKGRKYLNGIKKVIDLPVIPDKDSITYNYELKASAIYDLIINNDNLHFEIENKPIFIDK